MALLPSSLDFTDKDFDSLRLRRQNLVRSVFPDWTDFNVASFGNILIELFAFVGEVLTFYQDNQARESRVVTTTQRKNVIEDGVVTINATQNGATWGLDRIDQNSLPLDSQYSYTQNGSGVHAYIIDTDIRRTHNEFGGRAVHGSAELGTPPSRGSYADLQTADPAGAEPVRGRLRQGRSLLLAS